MVAQHSGEKWDFPRCCPRHGLRFLLPHGDPWDTCFFIGVWRQGLTTQRIGVAPIRAREKEESQT
jgi:hypothetical protein